MGSIDVSSLEATLSNGPEPTNDPIVIVGMGKYYSIFSSP